MSEVRLVVREADQDWSGTIHGSCADRAIAALSADPVTMDEFEVATGRFAKTDPGCKFFSNLRPSLFDEPYDAGLVVIDLIARLVVVDSTYSSPGREGTVEYHCGHRCTDITLRYHLADDWQFERDGDNWRYWSRKLREERSMKPVFDARSVFYGRPLLEFIARKTFAEFARRAEIELAVRARWADEARKRPVPETQMGGDADDSGSMREDEVAVPALPGENRYRSPFYDTLKQIHVDWMLTPRDDLAGASPREIALERHRHLDWDQQDRCEQWSSLQSCPVVLDETSHAFQHGGFGTHELVMYYDLVRELLWSCWDQLGEMAHSSKLALRPESLMVGDFLTTEVPRLEKVRDQWLETPHSETRGRSPRSIIDRERARLPEGVSGSSAMFDADCPCCQMMAETSGPWIWHFDGSGMDDDFAFDMRCRTRDEWDANQRKWEEFNQRFNAEQAERERLGVKSSSPNKDGSNAVWSRSFSVGGAADVPLGIRVFRIGCLLAELIVGLRAEFDRESTPEETQRHIDQLNRDFGNLREILQTSDESLGESLLTPVLERFAQNLSDVAAARPEVDFKCECVSEELNVLLAAPYDSENWRPDDDVPF